MALPSPYIFIFTGTSGSGRKTAAHQALRGSGIVHIPSCTDRPPRSREHPDSDYRYVSETQFDLMCRSDFFAETVRIDRYRYGIGRRYLNMASESGQHVYLILNREGSDAIREQYGERVVRIFLYVDKNTVQERLESKGTSYEVVDSYLRHYNDEVTYRKHCEHIIENVNLKETIARIKSIVDGYLK
ncbi:guanylate kinase [Paenibacillus soyae]|uniref:Guanylate kinase n=1 Tax=Paenibacillus soyae TaxID=2969249 RepID=A0A9X2N0V2_9BACL|nr:guanylate kinase [Paenibacillus soyae]MCR2807027.1 guanylate kinase [Paenibacillus soyae]